MRVLMFALLASWLGVTQALPQVGDAATLELRAQTRACYLGFIKLYDVDYLADESGSRCVRVSYLRDFSKQDLGSATDKVFAKLHGDEVAERYQDVLTSVNAAYEAVQEGDVYTYCREPARGGVLLRNQQAVKLINSDDFAERFLQIWVKGESPDGRPEWRFNSC